MIPFVRRSPLAASASEYQTARKGDLAVDIILAHFFFG
jgi:hypothetical protein